MIIRLELVKHSSCVHDELQFLVDDLLVNLVRLSRGVLLNHSKLLLEMLMKSYA